MSEWQPIETAPKDGARVDLWLQVYASPHSFGWSDAFRVIDCWWKDGKWVHRRDDGRVEALYPDYITHWMPIPDPPVDGEP